MLVCLFINSNIDIVNSYLWMKKQIIYNFAKLTGDYNSAAG